MKRKMGIEIEVEHTYAGSNYFTFIRDTNGRRWRCNGHCDTKLGAWLRGRELRGVLERGHDSEIRRRFLL